MKLRKKLTAEPEVFTDSLNDIIFILLMFFLIVSTLANPNVIKVNNPRGTKDTKAKQNIVISIDKDQNFFMGQKQVDPAMLDSLLMAEVLRLKPLIDTPSVVINADTISYYGEVFRVMRAAKRAGAKVVANVQ
ncbi:MAG: biopolymer transporter ExbD [Chitinophagaceae bacterium]|nr:biopolymer transporter ExbD [Chitinophagaceae bacterium]MBN8668362.1 biopolymer transporter ExbD [Chitinophagales bacterium]